MNSIATPSPPTRPLLLASASPRRADLLRAAQVAFTTRPVDCDERWRPGESPIVYVARLAREKALLALSRDGGHDGLVLAADTAVWFDERAPPLGKPRDRDAARRMLTELITRREHAVSTAFALVDGRAPSRRRERVVTTRVWTRALSGAQLERALDRYLDTDEWTDKAGGYGIQGHAAGLVARIDGSYTAVVGLPLAEVLDALWDIRQGSA
ncbi:MAG: septum formation protein Maf [Myxococcales bacterium]|nr:septum formation protein Maf [Myxococcales bacterium]